MTKVKKFMVAILSVIAILFGALAMMSCHCERSEAIQ